MKKQYAIIGLGRFGRALARSLADADCEILAIDNRDDAVREVADFITHAVVLDATDKKALASVGVQNMDAVIVSIGEDLETSILVVMLLKELGVNYIIAKAASAIHGRVLSNLHVNRVIYPERDMAVRLAVSLERPTIIDHLELSTDYSIVELSTPRSIQGKTLRDAELRSRFSVNLIAIQKESEQADLIHPKWNINPRPDDIIEKGDILVVIGLKRDIEKINRT